jgi:DNA-binding LacI/PurR family transcriptional regulator
LVKRVSIHDIAREADVSITTVSHALNGKGRIPRATRERVRGVAERLGYRANFQARGLALGQYTTLAVQVGGLQAEALVPDFQYFVELLNAASETALELGFGLVLAPAGTDAGVLKNLAMGGAIVVDPTGEEALLRQDDAPVVTTGRVPGGSADGAWVDNDHREGTRRVLDHFVQTGRSRPALLTTSARQSYVDDAVAEYTRWCRERDLEPIVGRITGNPTEAAAAPVVGELLSRRPRPDAIYTTLDRMALGAILACRDRGIAVPEDLGIAAITDSLALRSTTPPVTALNLNAPEIGRRAAELLVALVRGDDPATARVVVPANLVVRESTSAGS